MSKRVRTTRRLEAWLKDTSVALFVLNSQRRLVFFNAGCEQLTGWTAADVLGQVCYYVSEADHNAAAAVLSSLAPPTAVWNGQLVTVPVSLARRDAAPVSCEVHYYPLTDTDQKVQASLGIIQPATTPSAPSNQIPVSLRLHAELAELRASLRNRFSDTSLIARSSSMQRVVTQLKLARQSTFPVLFVGESGSGREYLARLIHQGRESSRRLFVPLDCLRLPASQLESTLERVSKIQKDDELQPGAIFLKHVESLPRDTQRQVLDLMQSNTTARPDVFAATAQPLKPLVESDEFIRELYFALTTLPIDLPPLRNRVEDLQPLAQYFLEELNRDDSRQVDGFHDEVWEQFRRYNWPGNVRELRAVVTEARDACTGAFIEPVHLPFRFRTGVDKQTIGPSLRQRPVPLDPLLLQVEREQIELALEEARHNKAKAADLLGITRPRLYRRMEILGIIDNESPTAEDSEVTDN
jgi:PAS domain S-box-containing protein